MSRVTQANPNASQAETQQAPSRTSDRENFGTYELAIVLSHYDVGTIESIQEFPRGSRKAPKLILRTDTGMYLLKRRARGKDSPFKVAFTHNLQLFLASKQFPLPHLIGTRRDNNSMLQWNGNIYELFEYIKGTNYDSSLEATQDSGKILALFHKLLADYQPNYETPRGSYHNSSQVNISLDMVPKTLTKMNPAHANRMSDINSLVSKLKKMYQEATNKSEEEGLKDWPIQIIHTDWHPGNMLFRGPRVVAVIDYDTSRLLQRIIDVANGALQFSILGGNDDPRTWPDHLDQTRFKRFLMGYDSVPGCMLSRVELRAVPWLMIEALIAEAAIPIGLTGMFSRIEGYEFLMMVVRKCEWMKENAEELSKVLED
jgi:homoserine kinase type II